VFPATAILRDEHRLILRAIDLLDLGAAARGGRVPADAWWGALSQWPRSFADRNHHAKEELHLFPALARSGIPIIGAPVGVMLEEHTEARRADRRAERARWGASGRGGATVRPAAARSHPDGERARVPDGGCGARPR
jgi:hemerythrin-like domain-containing protein